MAPAASKTRLYRPAEIVPRRIEAVLPSSEQSVVSRLLKAHHQLGRDLMKLKLAFVATFFVSAQAFGQSSSLLAGGWSTGNTTRLTTITGPGNLSLRVFRIETTILADSDVPGFTVIADGVRIPVQFTEGSGVIVEAKSVAIEQTTPGRLIRGTWKVIQQPDIAAEVLPWAATQRLNSELLIASFQTEREFVLSINSTSSNCVGTAMTVTIDGTPIKDTRGATLSFAEGSSVVGKGKLVVVRSAGSCTGLSTVNGDLRIAR